MLTFIGLLLYILLISATYFLRVHKTDVHVHCTCSNMIECSRSFTTCAKDSYRNGDKRRSKSCLCFILHVAYRAVQTSCKQVIASFPGSLIFSTLHNMCVTSGDTDFHPWHNGALKLQNSEVLDKQSAVNQQLEPLHNLHHNSKVSICTESL